MRHFEDWIEAYINYNKNTPASDKYILWSGLSTIAGALERKTWVHYNKGICYPNLFVMLIGPAGLAKKSSTASIGVNMLKEVKGVRFLSDHMTQASLIKQIFEAGVQRFVTIDGHKYNNSSCFLYSSEAVVTLKENFGNVTELLTDMYDCGPTGWNDRLCWEKATVMEGSVKIFNPCINMIACSTPDWLQRIIGPSEIKGGFFSRIMFIVQKGRVGKEETWADEDSFKVDQLMRHKLIEDLNDINLMTGPMQANKAFKEGFMELKKAIDNKLEIVQGSKYESYYGRKHWHLLKLCQVLSASESSSKVLKLAHLEKANDYLLSVEKDLDDVFGGTGENKEHLRLFNMWEYIRKHNQVTRANLLLLFHKDMRSRELEENLSTLVNMQKLKPLLQGASVVYQVLDKGPLT